jgi:hypothetical protein
MRYGEVAEVALDRIEYAEAGRVITGCGGIARVGTGSREEYGMRTVAAGQG